MAESTEKLVQQLLDGKAWALEDSRNFFRDVVSGAIDPLALAAVVAVLRVRGPSPPELAGAAMALRESAENFPRPDYPFADIVGTGGDGLNTINLSTIAAITAAACGLKIIKHGNRAVTSCSGSFDLLQSLRIPFDISPAESRALADRHGICFLFAPRYHPGLRQAAPVRAALRGRTVFNLLGPLVNPACPDRILLGVADLRLLDIIAESLQLLGCQLGFVVHGGGTDEVALHDVTHAVRVTPSGREKLVFAPEDFGATRGSFQELVCHDAAASHARSRQVLEGKGSTAERTAVCLNVALLMRTFGQDDLTANFARAMDTLTSGAAGQLVLRMAGES
jgi:anthranilate phosphoribosyltransferase